MKRDREVNIWYLKGSYIRWAFTWNISYIANRLTCRIGQSCVQFQSYLSSASVKMNPSNQNRSVCLLSSFHSFIYPGRYLTFPRFAHQIALCKSEEARRLPLLHFGAAVIGADWTILMSSTFVRCLDELRCVYQHTVCLPVRSVVRPSNILLGCSDMAR